MDKMREKFENYLRGILEYPDDWFVMNSAGLYPWGDVQKRWEGYQAATAESQKVIAGLQLLNKQYREALEDIKRHTPSHSPHAYKPFEQIEFLANKALATTSPTDALDSYVAELKVRYRDKRVDDELSSLKADMRGLLINYEGAARSIFESQFRDSSPNDPPTYIPDPRGLFVGKYWNARTVHRDGGSTYNYPKVRAAWHDFVKRHNVWSTWE